MKIKINYIYKIIILIISIILFTGCNAPVGSNDLSEMLNGMPYSFYKTYQLQNNEYTIYALDKESIDILNGTIVYVYEQYNSSQFKENINTWTINYVTTNQYYIYNRYNTLSDDVINNFNIQIEDILKQYEQKLLIDFELYNNNQEIEKEFTINNLGLYDNIYIIDMYIPFIIEDVKYNEVYTILIPVNSFVGYEQNDNMQFIYNKDNIKNLKTNDLQYQKFYISKSDMD